MCKFSILYHTRSHSIEKIALAISSGIKSPNNTIQLIQCCDAHHHISYLNDSDAIIFGSPTYFGAVSSEMKQFFDSTASLWKNKKWRNKVGAAFTHSSALSGDKLMTLIQIMIFAMQHGMIWVGQDLLPGEMHSNDLYLNTLGSWIGLMSQSNDVNSMSNNDIVAAEIFGKRIATITNRLVNQ